jgi:hypothetical protein
MEPVAPNDSERDAQTIEYVFYWTAILAIVVIVFYQIAIIFGGIASVAFGFLCLRDDGDKEWCFDRKNDIILIVFGALFVVVYCLCYYVCLGFCVREVEDDPSSSIVDESV